MNGFDLYMIEFLGTLTFLAFGTLLGSHLLNSPSKPKKKHVSGSESERDRENS
ncbi:hypothetical protein [Rhodanobacter sp. DHB23]|uniref:hypothetical protein n=1 Tax=Rhodanobacter sp. DHB23 TaxID=2775923 RepID=UPI001784C1C5|nr:hypothetical protein [Rhodanobacter sp. DHB23]MBD8872455.1 hypothetical protein [Rhodanobacter sp. DHB23]